MPTPSLWGVRVLLCSFARPPILPKGASQPLAKLLTIAGDFGQRLGEPDMHARIGAATGLTMSPPTPSPPTPGRQRTVDAGKELVASTRKCVWLLLIVLVVSRAAESAWGNDRREGDMEKWVKRRVLIQRSPAAQRQSQQSDADSAFHRVGCGCGGEAFRSNVALPQCASAASAAQ